MNPEADIQKINEANGFTNESVNPPRLNPNLSRIKTQDSKRIAAIIVLAMITFGLIAISTYIALQTRKDNTEDTTDKITTCCADSTCSNYNGNFTAGIEACNNGECSACSDNASVCDGDNLCESGESVTNCSSDCDTSGYSEIKDEGESCDPDLITANNDECDRGLNLACITCPDGSKTNIGRAFCSELYDEDVTELTASEAFINTYCGGLSSAVSTASGCAGADVQFEQGTISAWMSGAQVTAMNLRTPASSFHINCFTDNGASLLNGATIILTSPNGTINNYSTNEVRNLTLSTAGNYSASCFFSGAVCNTDTFTILAGTTTNTNTGTNTNTNTGTSTTSNLPTTGVSDNLPYFYIVGALSIFTGLLFVFRNNFKRSN